MDFIEELGLLALGTRLKRLGERMQADVGRALAERGVQMGARWGPLFQLLARNGPMSVVDAAGCLGLTHPAVSQFSKEMLKAGLVTSHAHPHDERKRVLRISSMGKRIDRRIEPLRRDVRSAIQELLGATSPELLKSLWAIERALDARSLYERIQSIAQTGESERVKIVGYAPKYRRAFKKLNLEWIDRYFGHEDLDRIVLSDPHNQIIRPGGAVFFAVSKGEAIGCCALLKHDRATYELCKMAVTPRAQGRGTGERLARAAIDKARSLKALRVVLETHHTLASALRLYERLGFVKKKPIGKLHYDRTDVYMELPLRKKARARNA